MRPPRLVFLFALLGCFILPCRADSFDTPLDQQEIQNKKPKATVSCSYFDQFMIKQVDAHAKGAKGGKRLSVTPLLKETFKPLCRYETGPSEAVINASEAAGHFKGVVGHYVFLDAANNVNGATRFTVYDALTGAKVFDDLAEGDFETTKISSESVRLRYRRAYVSACSMVTDRESCWPQIRKATFLPEHPRPKCITGYQTAKQNLAQNRCEGKADPRCAQKEINRLSDWDKSASIISYPVEISDLSALEPTPHPIDGPLSCWPVD